MTDQTAVSKLNKLLNRFAGLVTDNKSKIKDCVKTRIKIKNFLLDVKERAEKGVISPSEVI